MIQGTSVKLSWLDQLKLSSWLLKNALTVAPLHHRNNASKYRACYKDLRKNHRPNKHYEISIAACETNNYCATIFRPRTVWVTYHSAGRSDLVDAFAFTGLYGHFVGTVLFRPPIAAGNLPIWPGGPSTDIWPGESGSIRKKWPPLPYLTAETIYEIGYGPGNKPDNPNRRNCRNRPEKRNGQNNSKDS